MKHISEESRPRSRLKPLLWSLAVLFILVACAFLPSIVTELQDREQEGHYIPIEGLNKNRGQDVTDAIQRMQSFVNAQDPNQNWYIDDFDEKSVYLESLIYEKFSTMRATDLIPEEVLIGIQNNIYDYDVEEMIMEKGIRTDETGQTYEWYSIGFGMYSISLYYNVDRDMIMTFDLSLPSYWFSENSDLETLIKNYIAYLGLDGLTGWTLRVTPENETGTESAEASALSGFETIQASAVEVPFVLYATKSVIRTEDDEIYSLSLGALAA